jgi:glycosyltransferase involved in cell wall biosynthesis
MILEEYVQKDARISHYSKANGGTSTARNVGMKEAKGEYYVFWMVMIGWNQMLC